jgi:predicted nuclease of predicted toxin-antitoxin system
MSVGLYMDVHVPFSITRGLRRRGVDVLTAQEDGTTRLQDPDLLDRAAQLGRVLFSMDEDLIAEAVRRQRAGKSFATVIYARQMETSIGGCISDLETIAKAAQPEDTDGQILFL